VPADRSSFDEELFAPIRWAADVTGEELGFPPRTSWLIGIDETELLKPFQQRILNTAIRSASGQFFYKLTTLPYGHYTLSTNAERELEVGHDFEYVRIDRDPIHDSERALTGVFVKSVYSRRQRLSTERYPHASLHELFGDSRILLPGRGVWPTYEAFAAELDHHLLPAAATRAHDILGRSKTAFANQVGRRLRGTIELRLALQSRPGHQTPDIYAGSQMFVRCADGNPRRIIRLFKAMLERSPIRDNREVKNGRPLVPPNAQTEVMIAFSAESLLRARAEEQIRFEVFDLVNAIGRFANASTYADRIGTDAVTTVRVDSRVSDRTWAAVMRACDLGLLYANVGWNNPDQWPIRSGYFHLAYVLAPHFRVLPRRGRSRSLALVIRDAPTLEGQLRLFREASDE
jgi:hypothetical protein